MKIKEMALIKKIRGFTPKMGENCFLADNATIIGDVVMGDDCSIWFNAVLRGDLNPIRIGNRVNIQDNSILHTTFNESVVEIGDDVTIGHNAIIHGAHIESHCLIGMGSILLDHVVVGTNTLVAAGSVVMERHVLEPDSLYAGVPAKKIKTINHKRLEDMMRRITEEYMMYAKWYREES